VEPSTDLQPLRSLRFIGRGKRFVKISLVGFVPNACRKHYNGLMSGETKKGYSIRERLDELYRRLHALPKAESADASFRQLCETLDAVEDELSGVEKKFPPPPPSMSDGRMYCPLADHTVRQADGSILSLTRVHRVEINVNGGLRITNRVSGIVEFEK
jgi:hypothetical protein